jgi:hypothetical protein
MSNTENSTASARIVGRPFVKGVSGNAGGRPRAAVDVQTLARSYTEAAVRTLAEALHDPKLKVAAACALLDRGWGRPSQPLTGEGAATNIVLLHLDAARAASAQLTAAFEQGTIEGHADTPPATSADLLNAPPPTE